MDTQQRGNARIFQPGRSIRVQMACCMVFFLVVASACVSVAFIDDPAAYGFKGEHAVEFMVALGIFFWGGWALLAAYCLLSCCVENVTIDGARIGRRTVFRNRSFDVADVTSLTWKTLPNRGELVFSTRHGRTKLALHIYSEADRLRLIRQFRALIPEDQQAGWQMFCHKRAVPLADRLSIGDGRGEPPVAGCGEVLITRYRYDRIAAVAIPATTITAGVICWLTKSPASFAIPASVTFFWLYARFKVRREGEVQARLLAQPEGLPMILGMSLLIIAGSVATAVRAAGYGREAGCVAALAILLPTMPIYVVGMLRADRERKRADEIESHFSLEQWDVYLEQIGDE